ncbi:putative endoVII packaging and recombination endonuclease [Campylobacter phage CP21]|uniref:EndoVII packaging and recombination endonuclease n=1 Tax=Campylobacter phage CP21 TaxID=2881391 RepID=I7KLS6_9CAUD|nr:HNH endonuclease [Campylobacter phage CP21]CCH63623.1 putative endoVII packaging and recombination endonuclease [Campylobacter phage CP21]
MLQIIWKLIQHHMYTQAKTKKLKEMFPKSLYNKLIKAIHLETKKDINYIKKKIKHTKYLSQKTKDLLISYGLYKI